MRKILILNAQDNIAIALADLEINDEISEGSLTIKIVNKIPRGHKLASKAIPDGDGIIKYGERMGHAITNIGVGEHVHTHNVLGDRLSTDRSK